MLIRQFKRLEHEEFGTHGWRMVGAPSTYVPIPGMGVAHDLLEHRLNDEGTVKDEMLALGASLYIRGESNYWGNQGNVNPPGAHVGSDMGNDLAIKYEGISHGLPDPGRTQCLESHVEEWLDQAMREARTHIREYMDGYSADEKPFTKAEIDEYLNRARGWLRKGYRAARRRYKGIDVCVLGHLFSQVEKKADALLNDDMADYCPMVVRLDVKRGNVRVYLDESSLDDEWN